VRIARLILNQLLLISSEARLFWPVSHTLLPSVFPAVIRCEIQQSLRSLHFESSIKDQKDTHRGLNDDEIIDRTRLRCPQRKFLSHGQIDPSGAVLGTNTHRVALRVLSFSHSLILVLLHAMRPRGDEEATPSRIRLDGSETIAPYLTSLRVVDVCPFNPSFNHLLGWAQAASSFLKLFLQLQHGQFLRFGLHFHGQV
jgi:hypothetical protein